MLDIEKKARDFAQEKHENQMDDEGKPYFTAHVLPVVNIVKQVSNDMDIICAAYLHDVVEDCKVTVAELEVEFNPRIAGLVYEVTHDGCKETGYIFPRLKTKEGIILKFADRLSNISRMGSWNEQRQAHYLKKSKFWNVE